ncbi:alkaline phosphatase family protein [Flavobacterium maritimum]|uniref:alkaline phosphatase family protein n=1 Tax=Flavobacterium maritimum TaxID=3149042 RepID=UPI0032B610AB
MKRVILVLLTYLGTINSNAQKSENVIIITTDGYRNFEVFNGMDIEIAKNKKFNQNDSTYIFNKYWDDDTTKRREKLMPNFWSIFGKQGQIFGNINYGNKVNNANPYWISFPGYSEIATGFVDLKIDSNQYPNNPNLNILQYLNSKDKFKGKVSVFSAWEAFDRILNEEACGFPIISAFDHVGGDNPTNNQKLINEMLSDSHIDYLKPWYKMSPDVFAFSEAMEELKVNKPNVLWISFLETDTWAHRGQYAFYLNAAHQVDIYIKKVWDFIQNDPKYKDKTTLFITTDHGRGNIIKEEWTSHGKNIQDASQIWFAAVGPQIKPLGEIKKENQIYIEQFAQTVANQLGEIFKSTHPVAKKIDFE